MPKFSQYVFIHPFHGCGPEVFCVGCHKKLKCSRTDCAKQPTTEPTDQEFDWCYGCEQRLTSRKECRCTLGHHEACPKWDGEQAYWNLKSDIQSLDQLIDDDFLITMFKDEHGKYFIRVHHVHQEEVFDGHDNIQDALKELDEWVMHCDQGR